MRKNGRAGSHGTVVMPAVMEILSGAKMGFRGDAAIWSIRARSLGDSHNVAIMISLEITHTDRKTDR